MGRNTRAELLVSPGYHSLQARMGGVTSQPVYFKAGERETVSFACGTSGFWPRRGVTLQPVSHWQPTDRFGRSDRPTPDGRQHEVAPHWRGDGADWHLVLNVAETAAPDEIRSAYLDLIRRYHPDNLARLGAREKQAAEHAARIVNNAYAAARRKHRSP